MAPYRQSPPKIPHDVILAAADFSSEFVKYVMPALLQQESTREKLETLLDIVKDLTCDAARVMYGEDWSKALDCEWFDSVVKGVLVQTLCSITFNADLRVRERS
jgi:hypothetical protein